METKDLEERLKGGKYDEVVREGLPLFAKVYCDDEPALYVKVEGEVVYLAMTLGCPGCPDTPLRELAALPECQGSCGIITAVKYFFLRGKELVFLERMGGIPRKSESLEEKGGCLDYAYSLLMRIKCAYKPKSITYVSGADKEKPEIVKI
jgi:hypothetical protein